MRTASINIEHIRTLSMKILGLYLGTYWEGICRKICVRTLYIKIIGGCLEK